MNIQNIDGELTISLLDYQRMQSAVEQGKKSTARYKKKVEKVFIASKELSSFLNFLSVKVDNFDNFVSAFNSESQTCEIQKTDDDKYKIKLNIENETEENRN